jgi:aryl-alcohol dehydrogenase-like predicted oxidoreductase
VPSRRPGPRATDQHGSTFISGWLTDGLLTAVQKLRPVAEESGLTMSQLAVAWTLQNPAVSAAIIGATKPEHVHENVKASGVKLDPAIMAKIDEIIGPEVVSDPAQTRSPQNRP